MIEPSTDFSSCASIDLPNGDALPSPDRFGCRLAAARRKIGRWQASASSSALWSLDFGEVSAAAKGVDDAIRAFDVAADATPDARLLWTSSLIGVLDAVEASVVAYERALIANVAVA